MRDFAGHLCEHDHAMKKIIPLLTSLFVAFALSSCSKPTYESLTEDMIGQLEELVSVLEGIDDEASAKAAVKDIEKVTEELKSIKEKMKELGEPSKDKDKELKAKYEDRLNEVLKKFVSVTIKLNAKPEVYKIVEGPLDDFGNSMN